MEKTGNGSKAQVYTVRRKSDKAIFAAKIQKYVIFIFILEYFFQALSVDFAIALTPQPCLFKIIFYLAWQQCLYSYGLWRWRFFVGYDSK